MASILLDSIINETMKNFNDRPDNSLNNPDSNNLTSLIVGVEMGQKERIFWILLFSLMVLVAAGGNIIVIYIVSTNKEMKSVTNYFLVNLSLADTMVSTLNVIFNFISMLNSHWPFGSTYCKISNFIAILSISASVFTLTAISCDRYNAIIHPLRPRMSHKHAISWIVLIWTLSSALALPELIYSVVVEDRLADENYALTCTMLWPDGRYPFSSYDHIYNIIIMVVTYLVPILTMAILYYKVGRELWGYEAIGENVEKQMRAMMAKKKIVKMMIVVVIIFALCWLPYHAFFVVNYYLPTIFQDGPLLFQRCFLFMYWLAMSNSMYNPIIIYFMNSKFRHEFKRVLCFICCCHKYISASNKIDTSNTNQHNNNNNNSHQVGLARQLTLSAVSRLGQLANRDNHNQTRQSNGPNVEHRTILHQDQLTSTKMHNRTSGLRDEDEISNEQEPFIRQTEVAPRMDAINCTTNDEQRKVETVDNGEQTINIMTSSTKQQQQTHEQTHKPSNMSTAIANKVWI